MAAPTDPHSTPLRAVTIGTRKGLNNLGVLIMVTLFGGALATAAFLGKLAWREAFELGVIALGVFGIHSGASTLGIAAEDAARLRAQATPTKIDASSSVTNITDPDKTIDPGKPS